MKLTPVGFLKTPSGPSVLLSCNTQGGSLPSIRKAAPLHSAGPTAVRMDAGLPGITVCWKRCGAPDQNIPVEQIAGVMEVIRGASLAAEAPRGSDCCARVCAGGRPLLEGGRERAGSAPQPRQPAVSEEPDLCALRAALGPKLPPVAAPRAAREGAAARSKDPAARAPGTDRDQGPRDPEGRPPRRDVPACGDRALEPDERPHVQGARRGRAESRRSDKTTQSRSLRKDVVPVGGIFRPPSSHCSPSGNSKGRAFLGFLCERSPQEFTDLVNGQ